jgi:hypothetical protein
MQLTAVHKNYIRSYLEHYDWFLILEDDIDLQLTHWLLYLRTWYKLNKTDRSAKYIPRYALFSCCNLIYFLYASFVTMELCAQPPHTSLASIAERVRYAAPCKLQQLARGLIEQYQGMELS